MTKKEINIDGLKKDDAMTALIADFGLSFKEATAYWAENGGTKHTGFRGLFYTKLTADGNMTEAEVKAYCKEFGSANDAKHWTHYNTIAELVASVRA